jgi:hypothetical protein
MSHSPWHGRGDEVEVAAGAVEQEHEVPTGRVVADLRVRAKQHEQQQESTAVAAEGDWVVKVCTKHQLQVDV